MPSLKDRKWLWSDVCKFCEHCWELHVEDPSENEFHQQYYCLLDLSEEERDYLYSQVHKTVFRETKLSKRFCQLMQIEEIDDLAGVSSRTVDVADCCDYYETASGLRDVERVMKEGSNE